MPTYPPLCTGPARPKLAPRIGRSSVADRGVTPRRQPTTTKPESSFMPSASFRRAAVAAALLVSAAASFAQPAPLAPREVPAKTILVPNTVSPEMQQIIAQPLRTAWDTPP